MDEANVFEQALLQLHHQLSTAEEFEIKENLAGFINFLLLNNFNRLLEILYRVDIDEEKLKQLLRENPHTDAAHIITDLIILRQKEKIQTKKDFKQDVDIDEDEKW
jgi:hypothetical protein